jgi:hypothetical protein
MELRRQHEVKQNVLLLIIDQLSHQRSLQNTNYCVLLEHLNFTVIARMICQTHDVIRRAHFKDSKLK